MTRPPKPTAGAANFFRNEAVVYFQVGNADAQSAAADEAIKADPAQPLPYYLKGQALIGQATIDAKTGKVILPPDAPRRIRSILNWTPTASTPPKSKASSPRQRRRITLLSDPRLPPRRKRAANKEANRGADKPVPRASLRKCPVEQASGSFPSAALR